MAEYIEREALIKMIETKAANLKLFRSLYTGQSARALEHLSYDNFEDDWSDTND